MVDHRFPGERVYQNMVLESAQTDEILEKVRHLAPVDGDILIASYPKTGTTWMEELTYVVSKQGNLEEALATSLPNRMLFLEFTQSYHDRAGIDILTTAKRPAIMKTHLPATFFDKQIREGRLKIIVTIRNPKDTLVSMYHFYRMNAGLGNFTGSWDDFFELYKTKHILNGDFFDWYATWLPYYKDFPNVQLYFYEDMKADIRATIDRLGEFIGHVVPADKVEGVVKHVDIKSMKANPMVNNEKDKDLKSEISPFIRKGQVGDWKNYFSEEQSRYVEAEYREKLESKGLKLTFE